MPVHQYAGVPVVILSGLQDGLGASIIQFDSVSEVTVTEENLVTQHPTESGAALSDHIVLLPTSIRLSGRFVDFPLPDLGLNLLTTFSPAANVILAAESIGTALEESNLIGRSIRMWQNLKQIRARKELVVVNVQQGTYLNMAIKTLVAPRQAGDGGSQRFQLDLLEVVTSFTLLTDQQALGDEFAHSAGPVRDQGIKSLLPWDQR